MSSELNVQFSARTNWNLQTTGCAQSIAKLRAGAEPIFDLTVSNPTVCGLHYDRTGILRELGRAQCLQYEPDPRGITQARKSVAQYYAEAASASVDVDQIFLTTSTSEAYSYLFRLHCDPGAEVLIAQPSYPLFEFLADLHDVRLVPYPLFYDFGWHIDIAALIARITPRTRALVVVHPNNPTGHFTSTKQREVLERICQEHGLVLIVDEVFLDYAIETASDAPRPSSFACGEHPVLKYVLSGLSKIAALPQIKASWIVAFGPNALLDVALGRLEIIADTFLSMNAPVQHALPSLLANRQDIQQQILSRIRENLGALDRRLGGTALSRFQVQGGWYVVLRVPVLTGGESLAIRLQDQQRVIVHPGYFYGFEGDESIVLSLLPPIDEFAEGIDRIIRAFA